MVQTYQSPVRVYKYSFEIVMAAYQKRFPTCPQIPIFVGSEITYEYHSEDGAEEVIERKCQLNVDAPYLLKKIAGVDYIYFTQKNSLDRRKRTLLIEASNISFANRIAIKENCFYYVHPENSEWTCFEQSASLDVKSFFGFESSVEKLAVKQYAANLAKGKEVLEYFIAELIKSGTTYIAPFSDANESAADSAIDVSRPSEEDEKEKKEDPPRRTSLAQQSLMNAKRSSVDDPEAKLEAEYIRRFLGQLSALEESRLCELKYGLRNTQKGKLPNDAHLLRFLRAREFDVARASEMIQKSLLWRKQHNVDKILQEFEPPAVLLQFFPGCWHHCDKKGRPLFILRLGQLDMKGLLRAVGLEVVVKFTLSIIEQGLLKTAEATKKLGVPISTWTLLVDLEGLSMRHLWRPGIQALLRIIEMAEAHYPETMGLVLIARAPRVFPVLWTLISPFIDENTRKKFMINSGEAVLVELSKYIDQQYLPEFLGGSCLCMAPEGGHVPKNLYRPVEEEITEDEVLSSTYQSAAVYKGFPHEVVVKVSTKGCVLTWDFDVLKGECEFVLYYTEKTVDSCPTPHSPSLLSPVERVTAAIGSAPSVPISTILCDSKLTLGIDLSMEEKPVQFTEGDSMQGSHYCSRAGTYILQWRHPEPTPSQSFDFSLSHHKCKIMYYYELLDSADFRGSVASLESCRSSFSSLAAAAWSNPTTPASVKRNL
ncbi:CRAL-TRIO domain-containing protein T23G5.2 [Toxocara canis]|uniref:CRAL-TRIO domain-containing protein T23G5.2 n=1 Tax=Toxocara canis TaxID=6265 RepID=A0A0B2W0A4_TOXCA|nr:CRAL-TRIO domain-containing protein T23G5.2 [Toxocara canis]